MAGRWILTPIASTTSKAMAEKARIVLKARGIPVEVKHVGRYYFIKTNRPTTAQKALIEAGLPNPVMTKTREEELMESAIDKFVAATRKPLRKPTKADLARWAKMPDPFAGVTDEVRERAFKDGYLI